MIIGKKRDKNQAFKRQDHHQSKKHHGHGAGEISPSAQIDLVGLKNLAGNRGKALSVGGEAPVEIDKEQRDDKNTDSVSRGKIVVNRKGAECFTIDLCGKDLDSG